MTARPPDTSGILAHNRQRLDALGAAWHEHRLVLFLGGGLSIPYGIPDWHDLVLQLLFEIPTSDFDWFQPHYRFALASWFVDTFAFPPTVLARLARNDPGYLENVRKILYKNFHSEPTGEYSPLPDIVRLIERAQPETGGCGGRRHLPAVVTFNYDDLLERALERRGIAHEPVYAGKRGARQMPILHVHGYLPHTGEMPCETLVLSEDEYHRLSFSTVDWVTAELVHYLHNNTGLFIGLSMTDPNLRRLLDATSADDGRPRHYVIRRCHTLGDRQEAIDDVKRRARRAARRFGLDAPDDGHALADALDAILEQIHRYEEQLLEDLGVETIWVERYEQIGEVLEAIGR